MARENEIMAMVSMCQCRNVEIIREKANGVMKENGQSMAK
jgi:hypothetical protein